MLILGVKFPFILTGFAIAEAKGRHSVRFDSVWNNAYVAPLKSFNSSYTFTESERRNNQEHKEKYNAEINKVAFATQSRRKSKREVTENEKFENEIDIGIKPFEHNSRKNILKGNVSKTKTKTYQDRSVT